jgi:maleylacetoacetate isomerase
VAPQLRSCSRNERPEHERERGDPVKLYSFFRSSAAYRVRIALNLKGISYDTTSIHLVKDGGHNKSPEFRAVNPQMRVPVLVTARGDVLIQSLAIIEYLDETHSEPPLLPKEAVARARVRALAELIACDIHPLNNTSPLRYLKNTMGQEQTAIDAWYHHWVITGFEALEQLITPGPYTCGSHVTLADVCLVPQVYNARRLKVPLERFPKIVSVDRACLALSAFDRARPENQPDAE